MINYMVTLSPDHIHLMMKFWRTRPYVLLGGSLYNTHNYLLLRTELYRTQYRVPYCIPWESQSHTPTHTHTEAFLLLLFQPAKLFPRMRTLQNVSLDLDWSIPLSACLNAIRPLDQGFPIHHVSFNLDENLLFTFTASMCFLNCIILPFIY